MVGRRPVTDGNALAYLRSADLPMEIAQSIFATRNYHVLWTHDFTGRRESGADDDIAYSMVADAYSRRRAPGIWSALRQHGQHARVHVVLVDQFYYASSATAGSG